MTLEEAMDLVRNEAETSALKRRYCRRESSDGSS